MNSNTIEKIAGKFGSLLLIALLIPFMAMGQSDKDKDKDKDKKGNQKQSQSKDKPVKPSNSGQGNSKNSSKGAMGSSGSTNSRNNGQGNTGNTSKPAPQNTPPQNTPQRNGGNPPSNPPNSNAPKQQNPVDGNNGVRGNGASQGNGAPVNGGVRGGVNGGVNGGVGARSNVRVAPPANAAVSHRPDGGTTATTTDGRTWQTDRGGNVTHFSKPGVEANFSRGGRVTYVHDTTRNVTVTRTVTNVRVVQQVQPGGVRVVSVGARAGFVERPWGGRPGFVERTYVRGGVGYTRVYRTYTYRNIAYERFVPRVYYAPGFYAWGYSPWRVGVSFRFGWFGAPWFGFYGGYFSPYPVYAGPAFWLTDYIIAQNLQAAYQARLDAQASADAAADAADAAAQSAQEQSGPPAPVVLSPEIKQAIADEVQRQLQAQQAAAANPQAAMDPSQGDMSQNQVPAALDPNTRIFVVSQPLSVTVNDQPCELSAGDVVTRIDDTPDDGGSVRVSVVSSKNTSCHAGAMPRLQVTDLQDMHNDFQAQVEQGMGQLAKGQNGLPPAPAANPQMTSAGQVSADPNAAQMVQQAQQAGAQSVSDAQAAAQGSSVIDH